MLRNAKAPETGTANGSLSDTTQKMRQLSGKGEIEILNDSAPGPFSFNIIANIGGTRPFITRAVQDRRTVAAVLIYLFRSRRSSMDRDALRRFAIGPTMFTHAAEKPSQLPTYAADTSWNFACDHRRYVPYARAAAWVSSGTFAPKL